MTAIQRRLNRQFSGKLVAFRPDTQSHQMPAICRIAFQVQSGVLFVDPGQVLFLEASSNYTSIHFTSGKSVLVSKTLKFCVELFPQSFLRIHKSFLINPDFLNFYHKSRAYVELDGNVHLRVSRSGKEALKAVM